MGFLTRTGPSVRLASEFMADNFAHRRLSVKRTDTPALRSWLQFAFVALMQKGWPGNSMIPPHSNSSVPSGPSRRSNPAELKSCNSFKMAERLGGRGADLFEEAATASWPVGTSKVVVRRQTQTKDRSEGRFI